MIGAAGDIPGLDVLGGSVLGIVLLLLLFGWLWAKPAVDGLKERAERAEAQRDALVEAYQHEIIPSLRDANSAISNAVRVLEETKPILTEVKVLLGRPS